MKLLCCVALLFAAYSHAGELLPVSGEEDTEVVQKALNQTLLPVVAVIAGITVEPIIEDIRLSGRVKRLFLGPLARGSMIELRIRIKDGDTITEEVFSGSTSAWKGTVRPGVDYDMLDAVAERAVEFVKSYQLSRQARVHPLASVVGQEQTTNGTERQ